MLRFSLPKRLMSALSILTLVIVSVAQASSPPILADTPWPMYQRDARHTGRSSYSGITAPPIVLWQRKLSSSETGLFSSGMTIGRDGTIYASGFGDLYALDPISGIVKWRTDIGSVGGSTPAVASDGRLYWGFDDTFAVVTTTGQIIGGLTDLTSLSGFYSDPAVAPDGNIYVMHLGLWSFTPSGTLRWVHPFDNLFLDAAPALGSDGTIYTAADGDIYAFTANGTVKWHHPINTSTSSPTVGADGTIYIGNNESILYAFAPDGTQKWSFASDETRIGPGFTAIYGAPAIGPDNTIYFGTLVGAGVQDPQFAHIYALNPNGTLRWKYALPRIAPQTNVGIVAPLTVEQSGQVFGCGYDGACYGWSPNGTLLWKYMIQPELSNRTTPLIVSNHRMLILDGNGVLAHLGDPSVPLLLSSPNPLAAISCGQNAPPLSQTLTITSTIHAVDWAATVSPPVSWLSLGRSSGSTPTQFQVIFKPAGLAVGDYTTDIRLTTTATDVANPIAVLPVTLTVRCTSYLPLITNGASSQMTN
jgi:outer membrane protein assembly factor BamB